MAPNIEELKKYFLYENGILINKIGRGPARAGEPSGFDNGNGYLRTRFQNHQYYNHQIIWALVNGKWPDNEIDHKDCDGMSNPIENLRECDRFGNNKNTKKRSHSQQPYKGIYQTPSGKWVARITSDKIKYRLGLFKTPDEAYAEYCKASNRMHGEFGRAA